MIVVMEHEASEQAVEAVISFLVSSGFDVHRSSGHTRTILGVVGDVGMDDAHVVRELPGVAEVVRIGEPFKLASRRFRTTPSVVEGPWGSIGGDRPWIAIEPVGIERAISTEGTEVSLGQRDYELKAGRAFDAAVLRTRRVPKSVGSLACLSLHPKSSDQPWWVTFVERGPSWGANTWIGEAEKALARGEGQVVLLEAGGEYPNGARTFEIAAIARAKLRTHLPIVIDVPTIAQRARYCSAVAGAAIGSGADGVILRVWVGPENEHPRTAATLRWDEALSLADKLRQVGAAMRR